MQSGRFLGFNFFLLRFYTIISTIFINSFLFHYYEGFIMGRIKTMLIKRTTEELMAKHSDEFTTSFDDNKRILGTKAKITSKKMRNIIAGYATRLKKTQR